MSSSAADLAHRLAREAEAVCRYYLSNGRCEGRYWLVGDVAGAPGRSMFVRLSGAGSGEGAAGKWTDAATGEHGDLIDLIMLNRGHDRLRDALDEARAFLRLPRATPEPIRRAAHSQTPRGSPDSARRLFAMAQPIADTLAESYLRHRGIMTARELSALRFHPRCYYRPHPERQAESWPALIAAVTDLDGRVTGVHRTYLDPALNLSGRDLFDDGKAPIASPRRAMGNLLGNGVRFGVARDVMAAGEGIETMLSLRCVMPAMPMIAALSAAHLAAVVFPPALRRLYIVRDDDPAGDIAMDSLTARAGDAGIEAIALSPRLDDFNVDLRTFGADALRVASRAQIAPGDVARFMKT